MSEVPLESISIPQAPLSAVVNQLLLFGASLTGLPARKQALRRPAPAVSRTDEQLILL